MVIRSTHFAFAIAVSVMLGCSSTARYRASDPQQSAPFENSVPPDRVETEAPEPIAPDTFEETTEPLGPEQDLGTVLAEAEAQYATGVAANRDARWADAQVAFEQAITILSEMDPSTLDDPDAGDKIDRLLEEIARDYQTTLLALGELPGDASPSAILLRLEQDLDSNDTTVPGMAEPASDNSFNFPIEPDHPKVQKCVVYWQTVARDPMERFLRRSGQYLPMMKQIVASYGIPSDVAYLPLIESGFNNKAYSYAHASGPWQFIASTGKRYGLNRNTWVDERRDFEKSTHAACQYLGDLYKMFNSWNLALAAYNGGEGRVGRQIKRQRTDDFWRLKLRKQTENYVPLFHAALMIAKDPVAYGFQIEFDPPIQYDWVATNKPVELKDVARAIAVDEELLVELNPELRRGVTPPDVNPYRFRVPKGSEDAFSAVYGSIPRSTQTEWVEHQVRKGETLGAIAKKYGTTVAEITRASKLKSKHKLSVGQILTVPAPFARAGDRSQNKERLVSEEKKSTAPVTASGQKYTIKSGDTLWDLAKKFGVTTSDIRHANNMDAHDHLVVGRGLVIPDPHKVTSDRNGARWYTVRRGDTILRIATKFSVTIAQVLAFNSLDNPDQIRVGQKIRIPSDL